MTAKVKICGLMRPEDAATAGRAGAAYLGAVFAAGPRTVTHSQARELVAAADAVPVLGVFGEQPVEEILQICASAGLSGAQLHGSYSRADAHRLRSEGLEVWRVVRIAAPADLDLVAAAIPDSDAVLVEPRVPRALGGTGISLDLAVATQARERLSGHPMVLAGGLTPDSVSDALALVRPEIVDVSSGVERRPGEKDPAKILNFLEAVVAHSPIT
jgi:phosphoribosylanthranilate isomerase